jgi:uncharacterized repeat protein (TIGR01451 family)
MRTVFLLLVASLALAAPLSAQAGEGERALRITATNVTAEAAGRDAAAEAILPGDVVEYRLTFTNLQEVAVQDVVFENPLTNGLVLVLGTAEADREGVRIDYSIDGGTTWSSAPEVEVVEGGTSVRRPAPAAAYTHVRWTITDPVAPGDRVVARFRASAGSGSQEG